MDKISNDVDNVDLDLDLDWFNKVQDIDKKYSILELTNINNITIYFFYLDKLHTKITNIKKNSVKLYKNTLKNDLLIHIINDYLINDKIKYKIDDILKYNDNTTTIHILKNININKYNYLTSLNHKQDIQFQQTLKGFIHLNSIYIILIPDTTNK